MLNRLHFKQTPEQRIFFASDIHGAHNKDFILNPRGYKDVHEAYVHLFQAWNETVGPNDIVFNLGDWVVGAGTDSVKIAKEMIHGLNGKIYTLFGNHTAGVKQIYRDTLVQQYGITDDKVEVYPVNYQNKFIFLGDYAEVIIDGQLCVLSHYPLGSWNHMADSYHMFGHVHGNYKRNPDLRYIDVSWDYKKRPVSFDEIKIEMDKVEFKPVDHHGK